MTYPKADPKLRELQEELLQKRKSPWQPRCVSRAFCSAAADRPFIFTMQVWIDLSEIQSPLLEMKLPEEGALSSLLEALHAFGQSEARTDHLTPDEAVTIYLEMMEEIARAFSMMLDIQPPGPPSEEGRIDNGIGNWLSVLACLISQIGLPLETARHLPVEQAFALIGGHRSNQCWTVKRETYANRDKD